MSSQAGNQREIKIKFIHKPIHIGSTIATKNTCNFWSLGTALQGICREDFCVICNTFGFLCLGACAIDSTRGLRGIASAERRLVDENCAGTILNKCVTG
jgi:hypothetical protein